MKTKRAIKLFRPCGETQIKPEDKEMGSNATREAVDQREGAEDNRSLPRHCLAGNVAKRFLCIDRCMGVVLLRDTGKMARKERKPKP
jgi:hypothetical protein